MELAGISVCFAHRTLRVSTASHEDGTGDCLRFQFRLRRICIYGAAIDSRRQGIGNEITCASDYICKKADQPCYNKKDINSTHDERF